MPDAYCNPSQAVRSDEIGLSKRQCVFNPQTSKYDCDENIPSVKQMVDRMRDKDDQGTADAEHSVVFYTNLGTEHKVSEQWIFGWLKKEGLEDKYYYLRTVINEKWYVAQALHILENMGEPHNIENFSNCYCQALSVAAVHPIAYLFTTKGAKWREDSTWSVVEYPYLTQNPNIKEIWRVDPRPPSIKGISEEEACNHDRPELLWSRERGDKVLEPKWTCPYIYPEGGEFT
ncbi:uncharacterized protein HMPREF1541_02189 [Cyphellophora europaea CBS 101466]|uniref:Uncharacterized protein n=1 Tax=Cyphellophora europaea (strain CBS 101466) TaxID=1220924 RepID=W2S2U0_CYPE1|nr:uncharacterized protein HMPREF1541_02189 [Cyphellophora europaea CBS 101466]ETN43031.1 hypothetical protein HMPREF1541_02189 [Cyphellophora europaea CBS 101466]